MRAQAILVASVLAFGALAGCMGAAKDEPVDPNDLASGDPPASGGGVGSGVSLSVLAPLATSVAYDGPEWVVTGTEIPVSAVEPANAKGAVTYAWAIGALPGTADVTEVKMDTGSAKSADWIAPGASKSLTYGTAGVYAMHCHPHPNMRHNVTVIDGYAGPKNVEVFISDGAKPEEYRFVPENIVVGKGTTVTYKNVGAQPHTATSMGVQEPPLTLLPLAAASGTVKVDAEGWSRILVVATDSEGRLGIAQKNVYATATLPSFETQTITMEFQYGTPSAAADLPVAAAPKSEPVRLEQPGTVTINYTFTDAVGGAGGPNNAEVEIHFTKDGETQDTITIDASDAGSATGKAPAGAFKLTVVPLQGAQISGTVVIDVVYDLVPPAPNAPAPADDGHGGHAH